MSNINKKNNHDSRAFFKLIGAIVGAFGGFAALFVAFGYMTLQSFLSHMKLYGLASFPLQFFKEATVTFLRDTLDFYSNKGLFIFSLVLIIGLPVIFRKFKIFQRLKRICGILCLIVVPIIVFLTFTLGILKHEYRQEIFFFAVSIPVLVSLFLYLVLHFDRIDLKKPLKNSYGVFMILFLLLFLVLPIGYGSNFYDIPVFITSVPECTSPLAAFEEAARKYKLLYLMGHTSDREIFFDATTSPITIIVVDKKLIKSIKVNYSQSMTNRLRDLFSMERENLFTEHDELREKIMGKSDEVDKDEVLDWIEQKPVNLETKKGEKK